MSSGLRLRTFAATGCASEGTKAHELVSAKLVGFILLKATGCFLHERIVDPKVRSARTFGLRPDPITPVVAVGEASSRPANHRDTKFSQGLDKVLPYAADIGDRRILAHPHSVIDHATNMVGELAMQGWRNYSNRLIEQNCHPAVCRLRRPRGRNGKGCRRGFLQELAPSKAHRYVSEYKLHPELNFTGITCGVRPSEAVLPKVREVTL